MKILICDTDVGLDIARQIALSGDHQIYYWNTWIRSHPELQDLVYGEGILESLGIKRVENYWHLVEDVDLIVFTDCYWGEDIDFLRSRGYKVFGASKEGQDLENDRMFAKKICKQYDMDIPVTEEMGITEAIDFVKEQGKVYVVKFSNIRSEGLATYVPVNVEDCIDYLGKAADIDNTIDVILEEVVDGIESAITAYFNGAKFVPPYFINFEHKKLFDGEIGPSTGEQGTLLLATYDEELPFVKYLKNLEPYLEKVSYHGIFDIDCIVNDEGYWVLEATSRPGYPISMIQQVLYEEPFADIVYGVASGELESIACKDDLWTVGVCLSVAGYPFDDVVSKTGFLRVHGIEDAEEDGCRLGYAAIVLRDGKYYTTPGHGRALVINGTGQTIEEARENAYRAMDYITFSDVSYRLDIGMKVDRVLPDLIKFGVVPEMMRT